MKRTLILTALASLSVASFAAHAQRPFDLEEPIYLTLNAGAPTPLDPAAASFTLSGNSAAPEGFAFRLNPTSETRLVEIKRFPLYNGDFH
jgi:hypothetical protein